MALVKPLVREPQVSSDDEIFLVDVVRNPETLNSTKSLLNSEQTNRFPTQPAYAMNHTPFSAPLVRNTSSDGKKWCRQDDTVKRKRTSISMLGKTTSDDYI